MFVYIDSVIFITHKDPEILNNLYKLLNDNETRKKGLCETLIPLPKHLRKYKDIRKWKIKNWGMDTDVVYHKKYDDVLVCSFTKYPKLEYINTYNLTLYMTDKNKPHYLELHLNTTSSIPIKIINYLHETHNYDIYTLGCSHDGDKHKIYHNTKNIFKYNFADIEEIYFKSSNFMEYYYPTLDYPKIHKKPFTIEFFWENLSKCIQTIM